MIPGRAVSLVNVAGIGSIRFTAKIRAIGDAPKRRDTVVDAQGAFVLPGLINAHDHLELNHYGRLKFRDRYGNATEWIDDMRPRLSADPAIRESQRHPLIERLFVGALKNLLAGVTTVAHHNPYYPDLRRTMPIRIVRRYGWAHSFALEQAPTGARGEPGGDVAQRWRHTAASAPFIVHLGEGVDEAAAVELARLDACGALESNTVLVHGIAIDGEGFERVARAGASVVWCPASNLFLFGRTAGIRSLMGAADGRAAVALGSDSRLTGARDLLDELRTAHATGCASRHELLRMVTADAARILRLRHAGRLAVGAPADLVVIPNTGGDAAASLLNARRHDVALVTVEGRPLVASRPFGEVFRARCVGIRPLLVDDVVKIADAALVRRVAGCPIGEPGVSAP